MKTITLFLLATSLTIFSCKKKEELVEEVATQTDNRDKFVGSYTMGWNYNNPNSTQNTNGTGVLSISKSGDSELSLTNTGSNTTYGPTNYTATYSGDNFFISAQNPLNEPGNTTGSGFIRNDSVFITVSPYEGTLTGAGIKQ